MGQGGDIKMCWYMYMFHGWSYNISVTLPTQLKCDSCEGYSSTRLKTPSVINVFTVNCKQLLLCTERVKSIQTVLFFC